MKIGSLFSGIGGLELGLEWSGLGETLWQVENDEYCRTILEKHWPGIRRLRDVREAGKHNLEPVDLICGGFPCQDVSAAGKGAGLRGARSGLWAEFYKIVHELEPEWVIVENVASGATRWVDTIRGGLELIGYETFPIPLSATHCGAPHLRRRVFVVGRAVETWSKRKWRSGGAYTVSDAQREQLWEQSRRGSGPPGEDEAQFAEHGEAQSVAHTASKRLSAPLPQWLEKSLGDVSDTHRQPAQRSSEPWSERGYWGVEPDVGRVANGVPSRMVRLRGLGNAVVPQCAQVIGEFIKLLITGDE